MSIAAFHEINDAQSTQRTKPLGGCRMMFMAKQLLAYVGGQIERPTSVQDLKLTAQRHKQTYLRVLELKGL